MNLLNFNFALLLYIKIEILSYYLIPYQVKIKSRNDGYFILKWRVGIRTPDRKLRRYLIHIYFSSLRYNVRIVVEIIVTVINMINPLFKIKLFWINQRIVNM